MVYAPFMVNTGTVGVETGAEGWTLATPGYQITFPRDHLAHYDFRTEWWYFTGHLTADDGLRFGYELTFFRQGIRPPGKRDPQMSRFVVGDLKFAHFTVTDVNGKRFRFEQKASRGAFGEAGFDAFTIAALMGHSDIHTPARYVRATGEKQTRGSRSGDARFQRSCPQIGHTPTMATCTRRCKLLKYKARRGSSDG